MLKIGAIERKKCNKRVIFISNTTMFSIISLVIENKVCLIFF